MATVTGITAEKFYEEGSSGRELAYAETSIAQGGITSIVDVLGLSIDFVVDERPVMVEIYSPVVYADAANTNVLVAICDEAGTIKQQSGFFFSNVLDSNEVIVKERIETPGNYTRKVRVYRSAGAGVVVHGITDPIITSHIRAVEL
jgi:hypothetical protein